MEYDVVYILKEDVDPNELKYSLRSLKNFPHGRVWFYGGKPRGLTPDVQVEYRQHGATKWERVRNTLVDICRNEDMPQQFWLFNDDFFCMKPCDGIPAFYHGSIYGRVEEIEQKLRSRYSAQLRRTADLLESHGLDVKNYAVHLPMLIDKSRALTVLREFSECPMFRCLYGNSCDIGGVDREDVKIVDLTKRPPADADWLSTSNKSFRYGTVGRVIRDTFREASEYEREQT